MQSETRYPDSKNANSIKAGNDFEDLITVVLWIRGIILQVFKEKKQQYKWGESVQGIEIKYDGNCSRTQRLSIEVEERTAINNPWVKSGIYGKSWLYVQGNEEIAFLFFTHFLIGLHSAKYLGKEKEEATIKAFYLSFADCKKYGVEVHPTTEENNYWANIGWRNA